VLKKRIKSVTIIEYEIKSRGDKMFGVTVAQAQVRLSNERRRRTNLRNRISDLEQSERRLRGMLEQAQTSKKIFHKKSMVDHGNWRGKRIEKFDLQHAVETNQLTANYMNNLRSAIDRIKRALSGLRTELTTVNRRIIDLERVITTGGI